MTPLCILPFFFTATATTDLYTLSLHDALPISAVFTSADAKTWTPLPSGHFPKQGFSLMAYGNGVFVGVAFAATIYSRDRKSTRLNSSHVRISYAVFCLKKKNVCNTQCDLDRHC